jgi:hypothetical protein
MQSSSRALPFKQTLAGASPATDAKMKTPSTNIQAPEKLQCASSKSPMKAMPPVKFGAWCFSGAWMLVLGAFPFALKV